MNGDNERMGADAVEENNGDDNHFFKLDSFLKCKIFNMIPETTEDHIVLGSNPGRTARKGSSPYSVFYSLRLTCRTFNNLIIDQNNRKSLMNVRIPCREITIAQKGPIFCFRMQHETLEKYRNYEFYPTAVEISSTTKSCLYVGSRDNCVPPSEFTEQLSHILTFYAPLKLEFKNVNIGKALVNAIAESFNGVRKANTINIPFHDKLITTMDEIAVDDIERILINFNNICKMPTRFLRASFIERFLAESTSENVSILTYDEKEAQTSVLSLAHFHKVERFEPDCFTTTAKSLLDAIEKRFESSSGRVFYWKLNVDGDRESVAKQIYEECARRQFQPDADRRTVWRKGSKYVCMSTRYSTTLKKTYVTVSHSPR